jgi:hypothetical protein
MQGERTGRSLSCSISPSGGGKPPVPPDDPVGYARASISRNSETKALAGAR